MTISYNGEYKELSDCGMLNICKAPTRDMFIFYIGRLITPGFLSAYGSFQGFPWACQQKLTTSVYLPRETHCLILPMPSLDTTTIKLCCNEHRRKRYGSCPNWSWGKQLVNSDSASPSSLFGLHLQQEM